MIDNGIIFLILLFAMVILFFLWPEKGFYWKWKSAKENLNRILLEDLLKLMFNFEYKHLDCTMASIKEGLNINTNDGEALIEKLKKQALITQNQDEYKLTDEGRKYALKIIRIHRIWERYLAEETGLDSKVWHKQADKIEHFITENEANQMAASIGNPVFDPHGDPIPSDSGELPEYTGNTLSSFGKGDYLKIIHIEDEPPVVFSQITAMGLYPGMMLYITEKDQLKIRFIGDGEEFILAYQLSDNLTVVKINDDDYSGAARKLSSLKEGQTAYISGLSPSCRGLERRRLMDLGIVTGTRVSLMMISPGGEPTAYNILGAGIALRKKQADNIFIIDNI
ncbi:MAG: iron dependent repressor, metal binding and dimerization domain protein [Deltaproteobacteria bacterium]